MTFSEALKAWMSTRPGMTQVMLAKEIGVSCGSINLYCAGNAKPRWGNMAKLFECFGCRNIDEFLNGPGAKQEKQTEPDERSGYSLVVMFGDYEAILCEFANTGIQRPIKKRTVRIPLTPDQVAALTPRVIGRGNGTSIRETLEIIGIETDSGEPV